MSQEDVLEWTSGVALITTGHASLVCGSWAVKCQTRLADFMFKLSNIMGWFL